MTECLVSGSKSWCSLRNPKMHISNDSNSLCNRGRKYSENAYARFRNGQDTSVRKKFCEEVCDLRGHRDTDGQIQYLTGL